MNYIQMLPVVDEWVLWLLVLLTPLIALCATTAFIVLHRERKTAPPQKQKLNLVMAGSSSLLILLILGFMLYSGLRIETNRANATENLKTKYDISSVTWETPEGKKVSPTDSVTERIVMVTDHHNKVSVFKYDANPETGEPHLENTTEEHGNDSLHHTGAESLLRAK